MLYYWFLFALILPSFAERTRTQNEKKNMTVCNEPKALIAGDSFFTCFEIQVNNSLKHEDNNCTVPLQHTIQNFVKVANESCYKDTANRWRNATDFTRLLQFSLKKDKFKDFVENGGAECIKAIQRDLVRCVTESIGDVVGADHKYHSLWKKTKLTYVEKTCIKTEDIKYCTMNAMTSEPKCISNDNRLYVTSLFDFMLDRCNSESRDWRKRTTDQTNMKSRQEKMIKGLTKDVHTTHVLLGLLLTLSIIGVMYVLFRDCRAPTGRWKVFNEQFQMRSRRRSLVHNEACRD